ncbi:MAG: argininosuccinate synthase [Synergistetes bacterium]|nr:argininosuccinate synthase [Synergistota bacterium]
MVNLKVVLAYSGGLDTSVSIKWLQDNYKADVIALTLDVGQGADFEAIREKALKLGAKKAYVIDAKEEFARDFVLPTLKANGLYEGRYPLLSALSRPLITKHLIEIAEKEGAQAIAHGCTGKGNDQVRFEVSAMFLNPSIKVIAAVREWGFTREEEIEYAQKHGIPVPVSKEKPYSIDLNLWGRSIECGIIENPWEEPPDDVYEWTISPDKSPDEPEYVEITFEKGVPVALNGKKYDKLSELIFKLNEIGGRHGVGRIDMIEDRLVGIKSREVYETPGAKILLEAHKDLEMLTLPRDVMEFKPIVEKRYAELVYYGLWYSPLRKAFDAFIDSLQERVSGTVRVKLWKGSCVVVGRKSDYAMYKYELATYDKEDQFDHKASEGFIELWGLPLKVYSLVGKNAQGKV